MTRPKILLADDHLLLAQALQHLLQAEFDVVGTVADGRALLKAAGELFPDVVVVDIGMPLLNGLDAAEQLKALHPDIKVIVLTQNTAIWEALRGNTYVSPSIAKGMLDEGVDLDVSHVTLRELSGREREVLQLLAEGKSMKEVAAVLDISPRTVEFHKYRIMELLRIKTNSELVQQAIKLGLIT